MVDILGNLYKLHSLKKKNKMTKILFKKLNMNFKICQRMSSKAWSSQ